METTQKILLNSSKNKKNVNENISLNIAFSGNKKLLPEDAINDSINSYDVYLNERKNSNKFRIVVDINPFCSNVLFNPFTEIVKDEGTENVICLNYENDYIEENTIGKPENFKWNQYEAIRDTQLSNKACGFDYHCGIDIFNNHILRNKTFKAVNFNEYVSYNEIGVFNLAYGDNFSKVKVNEQGNGHVYTSKDFNTIDDYMRDKDGWIISEHFPKIVQKSIVRRNIETIVLPLHLYQNYDVLDYKGCINEKLLEDNGWYGFSNPSTLGVTTLVNETHQKSDSTIEFKSNKLKLNCDGDTPYKDTISLTAKKTTITEDIDASSLDINKTINNKEYCDYIDMYPGRDLYSFTPKYNEGRKRLEKNWNYCLTYPSKNVIKNGKENEGVVFPFFRLDQSGNTSLKVYMFDEYTVDDDETPLVTIYTISQHGLMVGDLINLYKGDNIFYESAEVIHVIDKYIFQIFKSEGDISNNWIEVKNRGVGIYDKYPICESNRCNVDPDAQDIHIRRVINGVECKYYVRKFSRLPNFKFKDEEINDYTLYDDNHKKNGKRKRRPTDSDLTLIERFSKPGDPTCEFESHAGKLGFASTSYGDDSTEIVFTDTIDTSYLRDNLGRPLSDIYFTIVKNNKGYKEWYGIKKEIEIKNINVEFSHCFGKINSSFLLSEYYRESYKSGVNADLYDVRDITFNKNKINGLITETDIVSKQDYADEIEFDRDWEYYGDICCYSPVDCDEQSIQMAMHRFNTVQRELQNLDSKALNNFNQGVMYHNEIFDVENTLPFEKTNNGDPWSVFNNGSLNPKPRKAINSTDKNLYHTTKEELKNMLNFPEGYYYQPHYRINIKTVSSELSSDKAIEYEVSEIIDTKEKLSNDRNVFEIKTSESNYFCKNEKIVLYKRSINAYYFVTIIELIDFNRFKCVIADENGNHLGENNKLLGSEVDINDYVLLKKQYSTPYYARLIKDGSCRYCWRNILSNGIEGNEKNYPFTNGAFYINRKINFFLRRQDPMKENLGYIIPNTEGIYDYVPNGENINNYPNFNPSNKINYEANEIKEC